MHHSEAHTGVLFPAYVACRTRFLRWLKRPGNNFLEPIFLWRDKIILAILSQAKKASAAKRAFARGATWL
jgi:hypothetical protein